MQADEYGVFDEKQHLQNVFKALNGAKRQSKSEIYTSKDVGKEVA